METISAKVSDEYFKKINAVVTKREIPRQQLIIDALDFYLVHLGYMEIKRIFKSKIKME